MLLSQRHPICVWLFLAFASFLHSVDIPSEQINPVYTDNTGLLNQYNVRQWNTREGFPANSILTLMQGKDGFLWFGSFNGLIQFDGVNSQVYTKYEIPELSDHAITALHQNEAGTFYFGTQDGLAIQHDGVWRVFKEDQGLPGNYIFALFYDSRRRLWVGTDRGVTYLTEEGFSTHGLTESLTSGQINDIIEDPQGQVWVATQNNGLFRITGESVLELNPENGLLSNTVTALAIDPQGTIWAGSDNGLNSIDSRMIINSYANLPEKQISCLAFDQHRTLWIGTLQGVCIYSDGQFSDLLSLDQLQYWPRKIIEDREGNIWIGTYRSGVYKLNRGKFLTLTQKNGLSGQKILSLFGPTDGDVLIATDNGLDIFSGGKTSPLLTANQLPFPVVKDVYKDTLKRLWICTRSGLMVIDGPDTTIYTTENGLSDNYARTVLEDSRGNIWVGTINGLDFFDGKSFRHYTRAQGLAGDYIIALFEDSQGDLWVGARGGLSRIHDGLISSFYKADGLPGNTVFRIHEDEQGALWIGTDGGIARFHRNTFFSFDSRHGLPTDVTFQILEDDLGQLWVASNLGVYTLTKGDLLQVMRGERSRIEPRIFDHHDMNATECTASSRSIMDDDGKFWFATNNGVAVMDPGDIRVNTIAAPILIQSIKIEDLDTPLTESIQLRPDQRRLQINYTALSYISPERVQFKYMLVGYDPDWIDGGTSREILYPSFPTGQYTFKVIACNNDGIWNENAAHLDIQKTDYFYKSIWFYVILVCVSVFSVYGYYKIRVIQMARYQRQLEQEVSERTLEIQEKTEQLHQFNEQLKELARIDHLTGLLNRRYFYELLSREWRHGIRQKIPITILMIDIDYFKYYNDNYGHLAGDTCLQQVANAIRESVLRATDLYARYGGEEFIIALSSCSLDDGIKKAELVRQQVEKLSIPHAHSAAAAVVTISLGVASVVPREDDPYKELIHAADEALYLAKESGRNRVAAKGNGAV